MTGIAPLRNGWVYQDPELDKIEQTLCKLEIEEQELLRDEGSSAPVGVVHIVPHPRIAEIDRELANELGRTALPIEEYVTRLKQEAKTHHLSAKRAALADMVQKTGLISAASALIESQNETISQLRAQLKILEEANQALREQNARLLTRGK